MNTRKTIFISLSILLIGAVVTVLVFFTEPEAQRGGATKKTAMLVDVVEVQRDTFHPVLVATGTVQPSQDIILSPRVSGEIIQRSPKFTPGSFVQKGEMLLQIDPADYQNLLLQRQSTLRQRMADLNIEKGRQDVARKDFELVGDTLVDELTANNVDLVLRKPQLEAAKAEVEAARASVEQARLDLQRTTIRAPFDAHILSRNANVGSQVAPGDDLGRLVGMDEYWVVATIPLAKVNWLSFPDDNGQGAEVRIYNRNAWPEGQYRTGHLYKQIGALERQTRLARVIVAISDPMAYESDTVPPLMIGAFVEAHIQARELPDVVRLNRDHLRQNNTVWVMKNRKLRIREVEIIFKDSKYAYIQSGLNDGEQVVSTNLSTVVDGSPLRLETDTVPVNDTLKTGGKP